MDRKRFRLLLLTLTLVVLALICLLISNCSWMWRLQEEVEPEPMGVEEEYANLLRMISDLYIGDYDESEIHAEALRALVGSLDEWSFYMTAEEYEAFLYRANNRYVGIGVEVLADETNDGMGIVNVFSGSPADLGGILPGDIITFIDGNSVAGFTIEEMRAVLSRPIGDYATITLIRDGVNTIQLEIMYGEVFVDPIKFSMIEDDIGYIAISNFDAQSAEPFISAIETLLDSGASCFIFDVRDNSGGRVSEMTMMLDYLLPEGEIFIQIDRNGEEQITLSDEDWLDVPAVVLVNRYSYSAAEYFAAILNEYGYAETVGEQTTGKSRSQTTHRLPDGGALHLSTGQYLTKNRVRLHDVGGLTPDYIIEFSDEEMALLLSGKLDQADDTQLQKAISLLS